MALFGAIPPLSDLCDKGNDTGSGVSFGICSTEDYIRGGVGVRNHARSIMTNAVSRAFIVRKMEES